MVRIKFQTLALASLLTLPLATTACSPGHSPTEPAFDDTEAAAVSTSTVSSVTDESRRGRGGKDDGGTKNNDDNKNDDRGRRGRGNRGNNGGNNGGNDDGQKAPRGGQEFEAAVSSVGGNSLTLTNGVRIVVNGTTQWSGRGDLFTLDQVAGSLSAGRHPRVEGRGTRQADGSILANTIKAEDEEDD